MPQLSLREAIQLAAQYRQAGRLDEAEAICRQVLAQAPNTHQVIHFLAILLHSRQQNSAALELMDRAVALDPSAADYHANRGTVLVALGRPDQAIESFRRALQIKPDYPQALLNLGQLLVGQGNLDEAITLFERFNRLQPAFAMGHALLADALARQSRLPESVTTYRKAVQLDPNFAAAWNNLGIILQKQGDLDAALECFKVVARLNPGSGVAAHCVGNILADQGLVTEAIDQYRRALALEPANAAIHSSLLCGLHYDPQITLERLVSEHAEFDRRHVEPLKSSIRPFSNSRDPDRKLRIGYVSPDFCFHAVTFTLIPALEAHDRQQFEVHCYANVKVPDETTSRIRRSADAWHDIVLLSDSQLAEKIRGDGIDILIDLALHTPGNRAMAFARKPAPVLAAWLGYPGTTGLRTMNYRITDRHFEPPGADDRRGSERPVRLPDCWFCYNPVTESPPVNELPASTRGFVTFGSLNKLVKINPEMLQLWSRVLKTTPGSRLVLLVHEGSHRRRLEEAMESEGVAKDRIVLEAPRARIEYLKLYQEIDIMLDPSPYNGSTTTCDALWMGVPVLTCPGDLPVSRAGVSLLNNVGLPQLVATSPDDLVELASRVAKNLPELTELRRTLRQRMQESPLMDAPRLARNLEAAYRAMWQDWCKTG